MKKSIKLVLGGLAMALGVATCTGGVGCGAMAAPEGMRSYWHVGSKSSLVFTEAVLAERVEERLQTPLAIRKGPVGPGEKFICDVRVAHPAPGDEIAVTVLTEDGKELLAEPVKVPEEAGGETFWLSYAGSINRPGRYVCRFSHGDKVREIPFEVAGDGA